MHRTFFDMLPHFIDLYMYSDQVISLLQTLATTPSHLNTTDMYLASLDISRYGIEHFQSSSASSELICQLEIRDLFKSENLMDVAQRIQNSDNTPFDRILGYKKNSMGGVTVAADRPLYRVSQILFPKTHFPAIG